MKKDALTKSLAIGGTIAVWLPLLAPLFFAIVHVVVAGRFLFDYLMPAELGLLVLAGGAALLWASLRAKSRVKWIAWSIGLAVFLIVASQALAAATGLADGTVSEGGWQWALVLGGLIGYIAALISLAVAGIFLIRDLTKQGSHPTL